jgi:FtsP/CotA-like multicopper oxidase with cupredoxin domain
MEEDDRSRRQFLKTTSLVAGAALLSGVGRAQEAGGTSAMSHGQATESGADYTIRIETTPIEIAPKRIISTTTYNGQFPGPLLRFKEGQPVRRRRERHGYQRMASGASALRRTLRG